jgi:hypothetical protein
MPLRAEAGLAPARSGVVVELGQVVTVLPVELLYV